VAIRVRRSLPCRQLRKMRRSESSSKHRSLPCRQLRNVTVAVLAFFAAFAAV